MVTTTDADTSGRNTLEGFTVAGATGAAGIGAGAGDGASTDTIAVMAVTTEMFTSVLAGAIALAMAGSPPPTGVI